NGGLAMLVKQGADFTEAYQDHAVTETAPGHSTILSGRWPAHTGIIRNTAGVQDSAAPLIGIAGPGAAPARFRGTALFDRLPAVAFAGIPAMDSLTLAFALEGVRALGLGGRGATDLLAVSLSTTDAVGHAYGPDSREIHDQVLRLDRYLGWFLQQLFVRYGKENVLVVLTADHGLTPFPWRFRALGQPSAARVVADSMLDSVNDALDGRVGGAAWLQFDTGLLVLADRAKLAAQGVDVDSVLAGVAARLRAL